ncbi:MAG: hypothetical protein RIR88_319 [Actinomycetota bacterium]
MLEDRSTYDRLLEATISTIDAGGVKAVRVREIAVSAGVKEPSVYHFFGSRDGLIETALASRYSRGLMEVIEPLQRLASQATSLEEFRSVVRTVVTALFSEDRITVRSVRADVIGSAQSRSSLKAAIVSAQREANEAIASVFIDAQRKGWIRQDVNPLAFAVWYNGMVNGRIYLEMDPTQCSGVAWDSIAIDASMHLLFGETPLTDVGA